MKNPFAPGSISHATLRPEDLLPRFADVLEELMKLNSTNHKRLVARARKAAENPDSEDASFILNEELYDALDEFSPEGYYFGAHEGDGADFGWWAVGDDDEGTWN